MHTISSVDKSTISGAPISRAREPLSASRMYRRILGAIAFWHSRSLQRRALADLDAHLLRDIGINRRAAAREAAKPFWRD